MALVRNRQTGMIDLIPDMRFCCSCGAAARVRHGHMKPVPGEPEIVAISLALYVSGTSQAKAQLQRAPKLQICRTCLVVAIGGTDSKLTPQARALYAALRNSIAHRYGAMAGGR